MDLNIGAALWLAAQAEGVVLVHRPSMSGLKPGRQPPFFPAPSPCTNLRDSQPAQPLQEQTAEERCLDAGLPGGGEPGSGELPGGGRAGSSGQQREPSQIRSGQGEESQIRSGAPAGEVCYRSAARVVMLGHGADELCAGYGRHRSRFRSHGWEGLSAELALDVGRLWRRNLGRDDRVIADVSREARHPFLDESLIATLLGLPLPLVADLRLPPGAGDKALLRGALRRLGLRRASARVKRAIQFGSRLSRQANVRDFGSNRAANMARAGGLQLSDAPRCPRP